MVEFERTANDSRGCRWLGCLVFVGVPLLMVGGGLLLFFGRESSARDRLNHRIKALRSQGMPVDDASLQAFYEQHTDPADAEAWVAALRQLESASMQQSRAGVPLLDDRAAERVAWPGEVWESETTTRAFLKQWQPLHRTVAELALRGRPVRFPIVFDSINTQLPHAQQMRQAARLLLLQGQVALYDRDAEGVEEAVRALRGASRVNSRDPFVISQLVSIAIDGLAIDLLKDALKTGTLRAPQLQTVLPEILQDTSIDSAYQLAIIGERGAVLPVFGDTARVGGAPLPGRARDALHYLDVMEQMAAAPVDDLEEFRAALQQVENKFEKLRSGSWLTAFDSQMTQTLAPALTAVGGAYTRRVVQHRLAAVACGLSLYQERFGRFPDKLADLRQLQLGLEKLGAPGNQPFGYRMQATGQAQLWSFNTRTQNTTVPAEPLDTRDSNPEGRENRMWVWDVAPLD